MRIPHMQTPTPQQIERQTATSHKVAVVMLMSILGGVVAIAAILFFIGRT